MIYDWSDSNTKCFFLFYSTYWTLKRQDALLREYCSPLYKCVRVLLISFTLKHGISCAIDKSILTMLLLSVCVMCVCYLKYRSIYKWFCYSVKVIRFSECVLNVLLCVRVCVFSSASSHIHISYLEHNKVF